MGKLFLWSLSPSPSSKDRRSIPLLPLLEMSYGCPASSLRLCSSGQWEGAQGPHFGSGLSSGAY